MLCRVALGTQIVEQRINSEVGYSWGLSSTLIYTSELILCSTICVPSATRYNIHLFYPFVAVFLVWSLVTCRVAKLYYLILKCENARLNEGFFFC